MKYVDNEQPSYLLFNNFIKFTYPQFFNITFLQETILNPVFCQDFLMLKQLIIQLLLQTTKVKLFFILKGFCS
jgi:hypothetical protein